MAQEPPDVTGLLIAWSDGEAAANSRLMEAVYPELRRLARGYLRRERPDHSLAATALVHEAYLKLVHQRRVRWQNRAHFFAIAAQLAYLRERRPERLDEAVAAFLELLMSDRRTRTEPRVQLSLFCDAGVVMRDRLHLAADPNPVLLERCVRCWRTCVELFRDPAVFPSLSLQSGSAT